MSLLLLPAAAPAPPRPPALQLPLAAVRQLPGRRQLPAVVPCAGVAASQAARLVVGVRLLLLSSNPLPVIIIKIRSGKKSSVVYGSGLPLLNRQRQES